MSQPVDVKYMEHKTAVSLLIFCFSTYLNLHLFLQFTHRQ